MAHSEAQQPVDSAQQVTLKAPVTSKAPVISQKKSQTRCSRQTYRRKNKASARGAEKKIGRG